MKPDDAALARKRETGSERPTMRDVAALAGVSFKTVARVIGGEPGVRPATAERVMAAARELHFRPNVIAADLARGGPRDQVGVVIDDVANPFWARLTRAVEDVVGTRGMQVIVASSDYEPVRERRIIDTLVAQRLAGLVIVPVGDDLRYLERDIQLGTPIVFLDRPQDYLEVDTVVFDDYGGARTALKRLISDGHRRIGGLFQSLSVHTNAERLRGFRDAVSEAAIELEPDLVRHEIRDAEHARDAANIMLAGVVPPTAFFCSNNLMTVGAVRAVHRDRRQVAIVGFDDFELADTLAQPITVVRTDAEGMGRLGAELLLRRMDDWTEAPQKIVLPVELIDRGSAEDTVGWSAIGATSRAFDFRAARGRG